MRIYQLFFLAVLLAAGQVRAETVMATLSQKVELKPGDSVQLKDTDFLVQFIGFHTDSVCAVPNFNCGAGYMPPHPVYKMTICEMDKACPYVIMDDSKDGESVTLSIEDETSCMTHDPSNCFYAFARLFSKDAECMKLSSPLGQYYCLEKFTDSKIAENKGLCEKLPDSIYALKWNCYYNYAVRYSDPSFCDKYGDDEVSGRDRCLNKMSSLLKDKSLCQKISATSDYKQQCLSEK